MWFRRKDVTVWIGHPSNIPHLVVGIIQPDLCLCKFWEVFAPNETINTFGKLPTPWLRVNENKTNVPGDNIFIREGMVYK